MIAIAARLSFDLRVVRQVLVYRGLGCSASAWLGLCCFEAVLAQAAGPIEAHSARAQAGDADLNSHLCDAVSE